MTNSKEDVDKTFGQIVRSYRIANSLLVKELAIRLGVSSAYVSRIERRGEIPRPYIVGKIADVIGVKQCELCDIAISEKLKSYRESVSQDYKNSIDRFTGCNND